MEKFPLFSTLFFLYLSSFPLFTLSHLCVYDPPQRGIILNEVLSFVSDRPLDRGDDRCFRPIGPCGDTYGNTNSFHTSFTTVTNSIVPILFQQNYNHFWNPVTQTGDYSLTISLCKYIPDAILNASSCLPPLFSSEDWRAMDMLFTANYSLWLPLPTAFSGPYILQFVYMPMNPDEPKLGFYQCSNILIVNNINDSSMVPPPQYSASPPGSGLIRRLIGSEEKYHQRIKDAAVPTSSSSESDPSAHEFSSLPDHLQNRLLDGRVFAPKKNLPKDDLSSFGPSCSLPSEFIASGIVRNPFQQVPTTSFVMLFSRSQSKSVVTIKADSGAEQWVTDYSKMMEWQFFYATNSCQLTGPDHLYDHGFGSGSPLKFVGSASPSFVNGTNHSNDTIFYWSVSGRAQNWIYTTSPPMSVINSTICILKKMTYLSVEPTEYVFTHFMNVSSIPSHSFILPIPCQNMTMGTK